MKRETSTEAYHEIERSGVLGRLQWATYDRLFHAGPLTTRQVHAGIKAIARDVGIVSTRLTELTAMGVVKEVGQVSCEVTGMSVILWDVTVNLPIKKKKSKAGLTRKELERRLGEYRKLCFAVHEWMVTTGMDKVAKMMSTEVAKIEGEE